MYENLTQILSGIRERTGIEVRLSPNGENETQFAVEFRGERTEVYLDGEEEETRPLRELIAYFVENSSDLVLMRDKQESLRAVLLGEGGEWQAFRFQRQFRMMEAPCFAVEIVPERKLNDAAAHVAQCIDGGDVSVVMDGARIAVVRFLADGQNPFEFGQFLSQSLYEEIGVRSSVGIGCEVRSFSEIAVSYRQAATAVRMSELFCEKGEVHNYREYLLVHMLQDVPRARLSEYLEQFRIRAAEEIFEDAEMYGTAEEFLENSLNVSETSRKLFIHRNSLMYRLDKIERITGLNIRKFSDAVTFRIISILYRLLKT